MLITGFPISPWWSYSSRGPISNGDLITEQNSQMSHICQIQLENDKLDEWPGKKTSSVKIPASHTQLCRSVPCWKWKYNGTYNDKCLANPSHETISCFIRLPSDRLHEEAKESHSKLSNVTGVDTKTVTWTSEILHQKNVIIRGTALEVISLSSEYEVPSNEPSIMFAKMACLHTLYVNGGLGCAACSLG